MRTASTDVKNSLTSTGGPDILGKWPVVVHVELLRPTSSSTKWCAEL